MGHGDAEVAKRGATRTIETEFGWHEMDRKREGLN